MGKIAHVEKDLSGRSIKSYMLKDLNEPILLILSTFHFDKRRLVSNGPFWITDEFFHFKHFCICDCPERLLNLIWGSWPSSDLFSKHRFLYHFNFLFFLNRSFCVRVKTINFLFFFNLCYLILFLSHNLFLSFCLLLIFLSSKILYISIKRFKLIIRVHFLTFSISSLISFRLILKVCACVALF